MTIKLNDDMQKADIQKAHIPPVSLLLWHKTVLCLAFSLAKVVRQ